MYGGSVKGNMRSTSAPAPGIKDKSAVRQLSGMKVHGSHVKTVMIGDDIVDVPKIEYMNLLDRQLTDSRNKIKKIENDLEKSERRYNKIVDFVNEMKQKMAWMENELAKTVKYK